MDKNLVPQIQQAILGSMIQTPGYIGEVVTKLTAEDFEARRGYRDIFLALQRLHQEGAPITRVTVAHELGSEFDITLDEVMAQATDSPVYYCEMLRDYAKLSQIQGAALELAYNEDMDKAGQLIETLNRMTMSKRRVKAISAADAAKSIIDRLASNHKPEYLSWGIKQLDDSITAELGDFIAIGGYPSSGKTLLSVQLAVRWARKYRIGYFSFEGAAKIPDRMISYLSQVPLQAIKRNTLSAAEQAALATGYGRMAKLPIDIIPAAGMTVQDVQAMSLANRYQIIFIDYLQLVRSNERGRYDVVTGVSMALHEMAQSYGITVVALSQLSRPEKVQGKPKPPGLHSFRESGQIEQDLDVALIIYPEIPEDNKSNRVLKLAKNKDGPLARVELEFHGAVQTLKAIPPNWRDELSKVKSDIRENEELERRRQTFTEIPENEQTELPF